MLRDAYTDARTHGRDAWMNRMKALCLREHYDICTLHTCNECYIVRPKITAIYSPPLLSLSVELAVMGVSRQYIFSRLSLDGCMSSWLESQTLSRLVSAS